jgi:hypothetical protein
MSSYAIIFRYTLRLRTIGCAVVLVTAQWTSPARASETIAYSGYLGQGLLLSTALDLNGDQVDEFQFQTHYGGEPTTGGGFYAVTSATYSVTCSSLTSALLDGGELQFVTAGTQIGSSLSSDSWSSFGSTLDYLFLNQTNLGVPFSPFEETGALAEVTVGFFGFRWQMSDGWHYGWVQLSNEVILDMTFHPRPLIVDWAYEMRPDVPIQAGAVPEPTTGTLIAASGGLLMAFLRRKSQAG